MMGKLEIEDFERGRDGSIRVKSDDGGFARSTDLKPSLMLAILEKLEEIRCGLIDLEPGKEKAPEVSREVVKMCRSCVSGKGMPLHWKGSACLERSEVKKEEVRESCPYCDGKGTLPVYWVCSNCGAKPRAASAFCYRCGAKKEEKADGNE